MPNIGSTQNSSKALQKRANEKRDHRGDRKHKINPFIVAGEKTVNGDGGRNIRSAYRIALVRLNETGYPIFKLVSCAVE